MNKIILPIILLSLFLTSCIAQNPREGTLPTPQELVAQRKNVSEAEILAYCQSHGGHYEDWDNHDQTSSTYCILPQGYGCEPELFYNGSCGLY